MNAFIIALRELAGGIDTIVRRAEPWGIMLAVLGLAFTFVQFERESELWAEERATREEERFVRAWHMMGQQHMDPRFRRRSVEFVLRRQYEVSNMRLASLDFSGVWWSDKKLLRATLVDVDFFGSYIARSEFNLESGSRLRISHSDLTDTSFHLRHESIRGLGTGTLLSILASNISGARIDFGSACLDRCGIEQGDQLRDLDGSWYFAGNPPRIYIHPENRDSLDGIRDVVIYRVPEEYRFLYDRSCRSVAVGKLRCLAEASGLQLDNDIVDVLGIEQQELTSLLSFSSGWL